MARAEGAAGSILCFEAEGDEKRLDARGVQRLTCCAWACRGRCRWAADVSSACLCQSPSRLGVWVRLYLLLLLSEAAAVGVIIAVFKVASSPLRLTVFLITLLLQCLLAVGTLCELEKARGVRAVRRAQWEIRAKLCLMACGAWLPVAWWFFEFVTELRGRPRDRWYSSHRPVDSEQAMVALGVFVYHTILAVLVVRLCWRAGGCLLQHLLEPAVLKARAFAAVPESQRTHDTKCPICLADFEPLDNVMVLPCRHVFHPGCLGQWLLQSEACPLRCRGNVLQLPGVRSRRTPAEPVVGAPAPAEADEERDPESNDERVRWAEDVPRADDDVEHRGGAVAVVLGRMSI